MPIEINVLETRRFGFTCAKRTDPDAKLGAVNAAARAQRVRMISTRVDVSDLSEVHALEADGYQLMDTLVYYRRPLGPNETKPLPRQGYQIRPAVPSDAGHIRDIARKAFTGYIGHYHADPRLENTDADAAYVEWAENSIRHMADGNIALVALEGEQIIGFLTLRQNTPRQFEIVLNGVSPCHQRSGLYTNLLANACFLAHERGGAEIIISTQINNYAVQKVWSKSGMTLYGGYYTFHKWFD